MSSPRLLRDLRGARPLSGPEEIPEAQQDRLAFDHRIGNHDPGLAHVVHDVADLRAAGAVVGIYRNPLLDEVKGEPDLVVGQGGLARGVARGGLQRCDASLPDTRPRPLALRPRDRSRSRMPETRSDSTG